MLNSRFLSIHDAKIYLLPFWLIAFLGMPGCGGGISSDNSEPDPTLEEFPIAYVVRPNFRYTDDPDDDPELITEDLRNPGEFNPSALLMLRNNASSSSPEQHLLATGLCDIKDTTSERFLLFCNEDRSVKDYDVKDLAVSYDGRSLAFALRAPEIEGADDEDQPTWDIWQYNLDTQLLSPAMSSTSTADIADEVSPAFLPNNRILFSSSLQLSTRALLLDEGKSRYSGLTENLQQEAFNLHTMDESGGDIQQISFNPSHDLNPSVLADGRILFSRWDNHSNRNRISLYTIHPDGSNLQLHYGYHSHNSGSNPNTSVQFVQSKQTSGGEILSFLKPFQPTFLSAEPVIIDTLRFSDEGVPVPDFAATTETAQTSVNSLNIMAGNDVEQNGRIVDLTPLNDGRLLMIWSPCRLELPLVEVEEEEEPIVETPAEFLCTEENLAREDLIEADPTYGIWMLDPDLGTRTPVLLGAPSNVYFEVVAMQDTTRATSLTELENTLDFEAELASENLGAVHIRSVYDIDGIDSSEAGITNLANPAQWPLIERPNRFLRIVKTVPIPDDEVRDFDRAAFGVNGSQRMREIIGYTPIEPDGSAKFAVPANIPFTFSLLNENGERISGRHENWMELQAGEILECGGCHEGPNATTAHGRPDAAPTSANPGAPASGIPFPNTNAALFADQGESMAEVYARLNGIRYPTTDIIFTDEWTDASLLTPEADFSFTHGDLSTPSPISNGCIGSTGGLEWSALCRVRIHYPTHIQPIWDRPRAILDSDGVTEIDIGCTNCHSRQDAAMVAQVPAGQLDLSGTASNQTPAYNVSYLDLLENDFEDILIDGVLTDQQPILDGSGNQVVIDDGNGNLIPQFEQNNIARTMNPAGAINSANFFNVFNAAGATVDHRGYLSQAELRLIREWLDIGAQYYNDPFEAPLDN